MHVHQQLYQLRRLKLVLQGRFCLRASKLVLFRLLRRLRGDKLANQQRYLLRRHKPVNQLLFGLRASKYGLRGFCGGEGRLTHVRVKYLLDFQFPLLDRYSYSIFISVSFQDILC